MSKIKILFSFALILNFSVNAFSYNSTLCTDEDEQESATQTEIDPAFQSKEVILGILNIDWNMDPETAADQLKKIGCTDFTHNESENFMAVEGISGNGNITCKGNICCDGVVFNSLTH